MDEETEHLRDVFVEATGQETATTEQRVDRGSLLDRADVERLPEILAAMREQLGFDTGLDDEALAAVVRSFHDGADDAAIAADLGGGVDRAAVFEARTDLHLLREDDADPEVLAAVRVATLPDDEGRLRAEYGAAAVARARRVARAQRRARRVGERFRTAFAELIDDADLKRRLVDGARADGLREAAADIETELRL